MVLPEFRVEDRGVLAVVQGYLQPQQLEGRGTPHPFHQVRAVTVETVMVTRQGPLIVAEAVEVLARRVVMDQQIA
jgi:hypothetical protein